MQENLARHPTDYAAEGDCLIDLVWVSCPYCGESSELLVDPVGGAIQEYVEDCEVCCRPWCVRVKVDEGGHTSVSVKTLDDG